MASRRSLKKTVNYITELAAGLCLVESANANAEKREATAKYSCRLSTCVMTSSAASATQSRAA